MGFRNIHAFNLAMLAKQAWRLVIGAQSLFYRVYKAKYFSRCSFLEAELGPNPSFVWRSLCAARELIIEGSHWQVGNGQSITINNQKWLPCPPLFNPGVNTSLKVGDLIDKHTMHSCSGIGHGYKTSSCNPHNRMFLISGSVTSRHKTEFIGRKTKPIISQSGQPTLLPFAWTKEAWLKILERTRIRGCGIKYGDCAYHRRCETSFGELAQTSFLLELILRDEDSLLILAMQSMVRQKNQFVMHYGSVR